MTQTIEQLTHDSSCEVYDPSGYCTCRLEERRQRAVVAQLQAKVAELEKDLLKTKLDLLTSYGESEELLGRISELEADLEFQTNARIQDRKDAETNYKNWNAELKKQLAAEQLNNKMLREALTTCVCAMQDYQAGIGITEMFDKGERLGRKALAQPSDTSALDSFVAEKVKEAMK